MKDVNNYNSLNSYRAISVFSHILVVAAIVSYSFWGHLVKGRKESAMIRASALAIQIETSVVDEAPDQSFQSRSIASTVEVLQKKKMGMDPWGHPFNYMANPTGNKKWVVWSNGANEIDESFNETVGMKIGGDDLGTGP